MLEVVQHEFAHPLQLCGLIHLPKQTPYVAIRVDAKVDEKTTVSFVRVGSVETEPRIGSVCDCVLGDAAIRLSSQLC